MKINAVQFSTLIYLDIYFELLIRNIVLYTRRYFGHEVSSFVANNLHSTYSKKLFYILNIIFENTVFETMKFINFGQNQFLPTKEETP